MTMSHGGDKTSLPASRPIEPEPGERNPGAIKRFFSRAVALGCAKIGRRLELCRQAEEDPYLEVLLPDA